MELLLGKVGIGVWFSFALLVLRVVIAILKYIQHKRDIGIVDLVASLDAHGTLMVDISNKSEKPIQVSSLRVVRDASWWRFLLRRVVGLDEWMRMDQLPASFRNTLPCEVKGKSSEQLFGTFDVKSSIEELAKARLRPLLLWANVAGTKRLESIGFVEGVIATHGEAANFLSDGSVIPTERPAR